MSVTFKLFFKYVFWKINYALVNNMSQKSINTDIYINNNSLFYACTHMKMSTPFYNTQLCDMFAYEVVAPQNNNELSGKNAA